MNDTPDSVRSEVRRMIMARSSEERFRMGVNMNVSARRIALASFPENESASERRFRLFLRFYKNDFDETEMARVRRYL